MHEKERFYAHCIFWLNRLNQKYDVTLIPLEKKLSWLYFHAEWAYRNLQLRYILLCRRVYLKKIHFIWLVHENG